MEAWSNKNWAYQIYQDGETRIQRRCDLCGKKTPCKFMQPTEDRVCLCPDCYKYIGAIPGGIIKDTVMGFLEGNVI